MSLTKRDSPDGCGGAERDPDYQSWSDSLSPTTDEDIEMMAAQDAEYRRQKAEDDASLSDV